MKAFLFSTNTIGSFNKGFKKYPKVGGVFL